jgi:hypothetical protein
MRYGWSENQSAMALTIVAANAMMIRAFRKELPADQPHMPHGRQSDGLRANQTTMTAITPKPTT